MIKERFIKKPLNKKKKLIIGVIIITLILIIASYLYFFRYRVDHVRVIEIEVNISANCTKEEHDDWFKDVRWQDCESSLQLGHCSYISFNKDELIVYSNEYCKKTETVVIIYYRGWGSFSGGGDDVFKSFLKKDESITIYASHNISNDIYKILPDDKEKVILSNSIRTGSDKIETTYPVLKNSTYNEDVGFSKSFEIKEIHTYKEYSNVPVRLEFPYQCE